MKLTRLRIENFRKFDQAVELADFQPGINLFVGPNESGKSTLANAIRAAFFERYQTGSLTELRPWGDSSAAPEISLEFDWQGEHWRLEKRFLKQQRCDLHVDGNHVSGSDAEARLAQLLSYEFASKGASKARHHGIPGLLWVQQGATQEIHEPADNASDYLRGILGNMLGRAGNSGGDELIDAVEKEHDTLLTRNDRPKGDYKKAIEQRDNHEENLAGLAAKITEYHDQVDQLDKRRRERADFEANRPWKKEEKLAKVAQESLDDVKKRQDAQEQDKQKLDVYRDNQKLCREQFDAFDKQYDELSEREQARDDAQSALEACAKRQTPLEAQHRQAKAAYDEAVAVQRAARQQSRRQIYREQHDAAQKRVAELDNKLEQARRLNEKIAELRKQQQAQALDEDKLAELEKQVGQRDRLRIQAESAATRLRFNLNPDKTIGIAGTDVTGTGDELLWQDTEVTIPDIGTLHVQPGGTDTAQLARRQKELDANIRERLQRLGIRDLDDGKRRAESNRQLASDIKERQGQLSGLAPEGIDALAGERDLEAQRQWENAGQLAQLPEPQPDVPEEAEADTALDKARQALDQAETDVQTAQREHGEAELNLRNACREWERLKKQLEAPEYKQRQQATSKRLTDLKAEETTLVATVQERQAEIDAADPGILEQDVERHTRSAQALGEQFAQCKADINRLEGQLENAGTQGLEEEHEETRQQFEQLSRYCDEMRRRADALILLRNLLIDRRQALTRALQAPLHKHLDHYLRLLFPQASITLDENLSPRVLTRGNGHDAQPGSIDELSFGTREQMGLICRFAYADLLCEAGRPTLIILDDALVNSDADRLAQMKRIVYDAGTRHQILLFSCHPENWSDLGCTPRDMAALGSPAA